jgi:hypothetical protein
MNFDKMISKNNKNILIMAKKYKDSIQLKRLNSFRFIKVDHQNKNSNIKRHFLVLVYLFGYSIKFLKT